MCTNFYYIYKYIYIIIYIISESEKSRGCENKTANCKTAKTAKHLFAWKYRENKFVYIDNYVMVSKWIIISYMSNLFSSPVIQLIVRFVDV